LRRLADFWEFVGENTLLTKTTSQVDAALTAYANHVAREGEASGEGDKLLAAFEAMFPSFSKAGNLRLPLFARARKGWRKIGPMERRLPLPEVCLDAITADLVREGRFETAVYLQLGFSAYLRPGENSGLRIGDAVAPGAGSAHWSLLLSPFIREKPTKTGGFDEAISLEDARAPWLGQLLQKQVLKRRQQCRQRGARPEQVMEMSLWDSSHEERLEQFRKSASRLGCLHLAETLYVLRHGGASRDVLLRLRALIEVLRRGRWSHLDSIKHYEKHGRIQDVINKLPRALVLSGLQARKNMMVLFRSW